MKWFLLLMLASPSFGQECSHLWFKNLDINPAGPKPYVGDSYAAYGLMGYKNVPNLAWRFVGEFPRARFMSIETYTSTKKRQYDVHFDFQFDPNPGSENPFREGVRMDTSTRSFEVNLVPREGASLLPNVVHLHPTEEVQAIYYRIYVPMGGQVSEKDLPFVYAYNSVTGDPMACPEIEPGVVFAPDLPQLMVSWVHAKKKVTFKANIETVWKNISNQGNNAAIPYYMFTLNRVRFGNVMVVRFKAPTFFDNYSGQGVFQNTGETRYWSICTQNLVKGDTLNCLPDYLANVDDRGYVTLVVGRGDKVRNAAEARGFNFLEDRRGADQPIMQFIYRDLLPTLEFANGQMYQGPYNPKGTMCSDKEFIEHGC